MIVSARLFFVLCLAAGASCAKAKPGPASEKVADDPGAARPAAVSDAAPVVVEDDEPDEDEEVYPEYEEGPFAADLDGDGAPEKVSWACGEKMSVTVAGQKATESIDMSDLIGCYAAVVSLRPSQTARQLLVTVDEHDEAGPDTQFIYAYSDGKLSLVWTGIAELTFRPNGSWISETSDCDEDDAERTTTSIAMSWDGAKVTSVTSVETTPIDPDECGEP